jgi:hypothetical protein
MKIPKIIPAALVALLSFSCSSTGFMGLAKEENVAALDEKRSEEIGQLRTEIERLDALSEELEAALVQVERAKTDAAQAVALAKDNAEKAKELSGKMDEVRVLLKKMETRLSEMPKEAIDELVRVLQKYADGEKE